MINKASFAAVAVSLCLSLASPVLAAKPGLVKYKDWAKSPECVYLATSAEMKEWKKIETDADAEMFIALFWARRDPDLEAPVNTFRETFEARVALADKDDRFRIAGGTRGSLSERGKLMILIGPPRNISVVVGDLPHEPGGPGQTPNPPGRTMGEAIATFRYEPDNLPPWAGIKSLVATFAVEQTRDSLLGPGDVRRLETDAAKQALKNPDLKELPGMPPAAPAAAALTAGKAAQPAAQIPAAAPATPPINAAASAALDAAIANAAKAPVGTMTVLPVAYSDGKMRLMLQVYLEGAGPAAPLRLAYLVREKDGKEVARTEELADVQTVLKGIVAYGSLPIARGDYDVAMVLLDAAGAVAYTASRSVATSAASLDLSASPLLLAIADLPGEGAKPDSPFVFAGRRFIARGDAHASSGDGLSYFVRVYSAGVDPATKKALVKRRIRIQQKGAAAMDVPSGEDEPVTVPEGGISVLDVAGTVVENEIGSYFRPGGYTVTVSLEDTVRKTKLDVSAPLTILPKPKAK